MDEMVEAVEAYLARGFTYQVVELRWENHVGFPTKVEALAYIREELENDPTSSKQEFKLYECKEIEL